MRQENMHPHLHVSISSTLYPLLPSTLRQNGSKTLHAWFVAYVPNWGVRHKDYSQWYWIVCGRWTQALLFLYYRRPSTTVQVHNKFSLGQSHHNWSNQQYLIQWKAPLTGKVTECSPTNIINFCNGTSCLPGLLNLCAVELKLTLRYIRTKSSVWCTRKLFFIECSHFSSYSKYSDT